MGNFYSVLHHVINWMTHKQGQPVDQVAEWLRENDLEEYFPNFVNYGWDHLSVISEMTESDIEMCIQKPGHKVKLKRALNHLKGNPSIDSSTAIYTSSDQEARRTANTETLLSSANNSFNISEDTQALTDSLQPRQYCSAVASKASNVQSDFESDQENMFEGDGSIIMDIQELDEPVSTPLENQKVDTEEGPTVSSSDTEQQIYGITMESKSDLESTESDVTDHSETENDIATDVNKKLADTNTLRFQGAMISKEMNMSPHIAVMSTSTVCTPESHSAQAATVNLTIIKHSEHTSITDHTTDKIEPEYERTVHHSDCLQDQMSTIASVFEEKDALYVETSAFKELKTIVEDKYWATILGKAGDGKSATAAHLLLYYQKTKGYQPSFLTSVRQWESLISSKQSTKQFVVIDDMFGSIVLDGRKTEEWLVEIEKMEKIVMKRKGDLMVVCTSRRHIFTDATTKLYKYSIFRKASIVDMTEKDFKLSNSEKVDIFKKYATRYEIGLNEETLTQIETIDSPHGFPHCVEMFCTNAFLRESGIKFFENPEEFVQKELHNFKDNDSLKFLVLLLVLYKRNRIHLRHFGEMVEHSDEEAEKLFKFTGIPLSTSYASMIKAVNALTNTYLTQTGDGYYTFTHESLKENVSRVYISLNSVHATKLLDFQQILTHVSKPTVSVKLPENELAERLTIELLSGNVDSVSTCASWQDPKFVDEWIRFVTITNESNRLQAGLLTSFLRRIFIPNETDDDSYDFVDYHQSSLITSLFENKMYNAVIAILNDKNIQKALGQDTLLECLEKGLEIVCRDVINISVVKDIVACQRTIRLTMLDGSEALCNALKTSDAETVLYLVKHTYILFDHDNVKSHISCLFQSSIDLASFKLLCPSLIPNGNTDGLLHDYIKMSNTKFCFKRFEYLAELAKDIDTSRSEAGTNIVELAIETLTAKQCICVLSILKKINANIEYVKKTSINGLHIICLKRNVSQYFDVLRYLVDAGVDPSHETDDGAVPLMFALQNDPGVDCLRWLLSVSPQRHTDKIGQGYFHYLLQSWCNFDILETYCNILLKACEDINLQDRAGTTPIMNFFQKSARHRQDSKDLTLFLAFLSSAEIDFHLTDNDGRNNLHYTFKAPGSLNAREQQEQDMYTISPQEDILHCPFQAPWSLDARELQEHYMYPISPHEDTILSTIFDFLVDKVNVDCFLADRNGVNPLMVALENYSVSKSVRKFLNRNIPDQTDKDGRTYFHYLDVSKEKLDQKVIGRVLHISSESEFDAGYDLMDLIAVSYANDTESDCYKVQTITESDIDLHFSELVVSLMNGLSASKSCT